MLVCVGAEVGVSKGLPQEPQNRFPSGTALEHDGQVATFPPGLMCHIMTQHRFEQEIRNRGRTYPVVTVLA